MFLVIDGCLAESQHSVWVSFTIEISRVEVTGLVALKGQKRVTEISRVKDIWLMGVKGTRESH